MSDDPPSEREPGASTGGVFGNLPDSRPGTRSPRRESGRAAGRTPGAGARGKGSEPRPAAASAEQGERTAPPREPPRQEERAEAAAEHAKEGGGLEDIAWAGVAAAAEAATIGVRLASRAIEALRGNAEKE